MSTEALAAIAEELPESLAEFIEEPATQEEATEEKPLEKAADPMVEKAAKSGWTDKEAWIGAGKDEDEWVDAAEFVRRKPLFDKIHSLGKALKDKDEKIEAVSKYAQKAAETARNKVIQEFEEQRRKAVEVGDVEAFEQADKQLQEVRKEDLPEAKPAEPQIPAEVQEFAKKHEKWFDKDEDMTDYAIARAKKYLAQDMTFKDALPKVEEDVKRAFAHKFVNPNKEKPSPVASNNPETRAKSSYSYADLDEGHKQVWSVLKKSMTFDEFIAGLKEQGELK